MAEVDKVALYHYKLKVLYEDKLRRRFARANGQADVEDEATQTIIDGVVGQISFGELVTGDAIDMAAEETDEEESGSEESFSSSETESEESKELNGTALMPGGSDHVNGRPIAHSPIPRSPSQSMINKQSHHLTNNSYRFGPQVPRPSAQPQPAVIRKRSFSLKKSKSMNFSMTNLLSSRHTEDAPPVPPLPRSKTFYPSGSSSKPLPLNPTTQNAMDEAPPPPPPPKDVSLQKQLPPVNNSSYKTTTSHQKKKPAQTLNPPELEHIPKLLPVFAEIVSGQSLSSTTTNTFKIDETLTKY